LLAPCPWFVSRSDTVVSGAVFIFDLDCVLYTRGDVNGDGRQSLADPLALLNHLYLDAQAPACPRAADYNADDELSLADAICGLSFIYLDGPEPSAPYPDCGGETWEEQALGCEEPETCTE